MIRFLLFFAVLLNASLFVRFKLFANVDSDMPYWNMGFAIVLTLVGWGLARRGFL